MIDLGLVFGAILVPTWGHLGAQVGAMLGSKTAREPPKMPPNTPLGARPRPYPQNGSKMRPPDPQNEVPEPSYWVDFGDDFWSVEMNFEVILGFPTSAKAT